MQRILLLIMLLPLLAVRAQDSEGNDYYFGDSFHFHAVETDARMMVRNEITLSTSDKYIWHIFEKLDNSIKLPGKGLDIRPNSPIILGIKLHRKLKNYFSPNIQNISKTYHSYLIPDSSDATIIAMGINENNLQDFVYRVVENDSIELIPWFPIPALSMKYGAKVPFAAIGTFNYPEKLIMVEVRHKKQVGIREGYLIDWRKNKKPVLEQITASGIGAYGYLNLLDPKLNKRYMLSNAGRTDAPLAMQFEKDSLQGMELTFANHQTTPYSINLIRTIGNERDTIGLEWWTQENRYLVPKEYFNSIGDYELLIHKCGHLRKYTDADILRIAYHIVPPKSMHSQSFWIVLIIFIGIVALLFFFMRFSARRRLIKVEQQRQSASLQIRNIQAQLNPHFMFNAINSIQNLIQKNDLEATNYYLSKFSSLTRASLENAEKQMNVLSQEIQLLDDYLKMEQLRFGMHYQIKNELTVHSDLVEIPTFLLQPLVENAVKHGIATGGLEGLIVVSFEQQEQSLLLSVEDNGMGFTESSPPSKSGYGLRLTRERLLLLGQLYPENDFRMQISSQPGNTKITISISNWINHA